MSIDKAKEDYLKGMKYKDLAEKYGVTINTVKSWVKRYSWAKLKKEQKGCTQNEKGAHKDKVQEDRVKSNNRSGNPNPQNQFTKRNKAAETHGFFSKYLPEETLELTQQIQEKPYIDILWENITIQYAAIIRAQRIMYVTEKEEMIKELKKSKIKTKSKGTEKTTSEEREEEFEYEFQFSWDRQATFLQAQSRAMSELRSMIKQYDDLVNNGLATEEQRLRVEKLKLDIEKVQGDKGDGVEEWVTALQQVAEKRKKIKDE